MTLKESHKWAVAGAFAASTLVVFSPPVLSAVDKLLHGVSSATKLTDDKLWRLITAHTVVVFFVAYGFLSIDWTCE